MSNLENLTDLFYKKDFEVSVAYDYIEALIYDDGYDKQYLYDYLLDTYNKDKGKISSKLLQVIDKINPCRFMVYALVSKGVIVYIGSSTNIESRLKTHKLSKDFDSILFQRVSSNSDMLGLEMMLIDRYKPKLNSLLNMKLARSCKVKECLVEYSPENKPMSWETFYLKHLRKLRLSNIRKEK